MNNFSKKKYFVGVDISKDKLDLALLKTTTPDEFKDIIVNNNLKDFDSIIPWIVKQGIELKKTMYEVSDGEIEFNFSNFLFADMGSTKSLQYCSSLSCINLSKMV